jgi:hypothetical protein
VHILPAAEQLPADVYEDVVAFTNTGTGRQRLRQVALRIGQPEHYTELFSAGDNDLDGLSVLFTPGHPTNHYTVCTEPIIVLPTPPSGGSSLYLGDDDFAAITTSSPVSIYTATGTTLYVGSNGYVTLNSGDTNMVESLDDHFDRPRAAALFDDLNPAAGGSVSWKGLPDRVVVTWQNVPEYDESNINTFQIELFFDGRIRMSWLGIAAVDGLAGLSAGSGVPSGFVETDLSGLGPCLPPAAPGDFDRDGDVDITDFGHLQECFTGWSGQSSPSCYDARLDADADVDHDDCMIFMQCMSGANVPADLNCAD